jgi:Fe-S cluster assembly protein SufD
VGAGARFNHLTVTAGASLSRSQSFVTIGGEGAELNLNGATMIGGDQHADVTLTIHHAKPGSKSRVLFKNAADGSADGVFQGKIIVAQEAQKTDGKMMAKQLLLSEDAAFVSKPELEIYADDVQCGHGSTSGRIDETMLFYFLSRGIPRPEAERLLLQAFLADAIEAIGDEEVGAALEGVIEDWLSRRAVAAPATP